MQHILLRLALWRGISRAMPLLAFMAASLFVSSLPADAADFTWRWTNRSGHTLNVEIYSKHRNHVWPGHNNVWVVPPDYVQYANTITCQAGEKVCYGAWSTSNSRLYWGVGRGGNQGCSNCCYTCSNSQSYIINFDP